MKPCGPVNRHFLRIISLVWFSLLFFFPEFLNASEGASSLYYLHPGGNDANPGNSQDKPWKTLARANRQAFKPGDQLLLAGGHTFQGNLLLDASDAGTPGRPVVVGSYGTGRATIQAGLGYAVLIQNAGGIEVRDVICVGADRTRNNGAGVAFINSLPNNVRIKHVRIHNVEARGFGRELTRKGAYPEGHQLPQGAGILIAGYAADQSKSGFEDVEITNCISHDNAYYGILITGYWNDHPVRYANSHVHIADCRTFENPGDPLYHENHSGSGILVEDCDGGLVERCVAYENGALCDDAPGGPCGIWTAVANRVMIQNCESYRNRTGTAADGDGFDLDGGCTQCVLQYNYSHDNDGAGILVYTYANAPHTDRGNVVRWNVCENDSVKRRAYGAIMAGNDGDGMSGVEIYQNTFITNQPAAGVINIHGNDVGVAFRNNLILTTAGIPLVHIDREKSAPIFQGNLYWSPKGPFAVMGEQTLETILDWRKLGMEQLEDIPVGQFADPELALQSSRETEGVLIRISSLRAFQPPPGSLALAGGVDLRKLRIDPGDRDFAGRPLQTSWFVGACGTN